MILHEPEIIDPSVYKGKDWLEIYIKSDQVTATKIDIVSTFFKEHCVTNFSDVLVKREWYKGDVKEETLQEIVTSAHHIDMVSWFLDQESFTFKGISHPVHKLAERIMTKGKGSMLSCLQKAEEKADKFVLLDKSRNTPIHKLCASFLYLTATEFKEIVEYYQQKHSFDINQKNSSGQTALHLATRNCYETNIKVLIELGADVNIQDKNGNTPVMAMAAKSDFRQNHYYGSEKKQDLLDVFLKAGAKTDVHNKKGLDLLALVAKTKDPKVINLVESYLSGTNNKQTAFQTLLNSKTLSGDDVILLIQMATDLAPLLRTTLCFSKEARVRKFAAALISFQDKGENNEPTN